VDLGGGRWVTESGRGLRRPWDPRREPASRV